MKIGINAYEANVKNRVGSNEYAFHVLVELEKITKQTQDKVEIFLPSSPVQDLPSERPGWKYTVLTPTKFWTFFRLPLELCFRFLLGKKFDVFYSLGHHAPRFCPFPSIISIMDLAFEQYPKLFKTSDLFKLKNWTRYSVKQARKIIAISNQTKKDLVEVYGVNPEAIEVAYPGFEKKAVDFGAEQQNLLEKLRVKKPYILYLGTIQPRKNLILLIQAFNVLKNKASFSSLSLVIAGKIGWMADEVMEEVKKSPAKDAVIMPGFVSEEEKAALYVNADVVTLIGLYEGFGIPALEALHYGVVPVVSNTSSLPEVVGQAGILVDPTDINDIAKGIEQALTLSESEKNQLKQFGEKQTKLFTWEKTGKIIYDVLQRTAKEQT